jgi:hypothetical protein
VLHEEKVKIRVPLFMDDPILGRIIAFSPIPIFSDLILIEHGQLIYSGSKFSTKQAKSFNLKKIEKMLLMKTEVTPWTSDHRLDPYGLIGTAIELYLVDRRGESHLLIPKFIVNVHNWGLKKWNRFLSDLSKHSGLPIEVSEEPNKRHKS